MKRIKGQKAIYAAAGIAAAAWMPPGAIAQENAARTAVEEVLVTARRREESLQEVPIAISAFNGDNLEARSVENVANMNAVAPNLSVTGGGNSGESEATFRVRGMPGVSVYIDGVNQASTDGLFTLGVVEVDRIEVLRGPQGTLFGNASLGGAVQYVTRAPADTFGARISGSIGSYNRRDITASVDLPLTDTFKSKFTVASNTRDGFMRSVVIDRAFGDENDELARADFLWTPIDSFSARYNVEKSVTDRIGPARAVREIGPVQVFQVGTNPPFNANAEVQGYINAFGLFYNEQNYVSGYPGGALGELETAVNWETNGLTVDMMRHTLDLNYDFTDNLRIRSISGYKEIQRGVQVDFDGAANVYLAERDNRSRRYDFTQELQLLGSIGENVDWVLGGFYEVSKVRARTITWSLPEFTCDLWATGNLAPRGVSLQDQVNCFNNRSRAVGASGTFLAGATTTRAQLTALNTAMVAARPNLNGVTPTVYQSQVGSNNDNMTITEPETQAIFGDLTWRITDQLTAAFGLRYSEDESPGSIQVAGTALGSRATLFPDNDIPNYFGFNESLLPLPTGANKYDALTKRISLQYRWNPDVMTYISYADGYGPGGVANPPGTVLTVNAAGVASGFMRDVYNAGLSDIPGSLARDEQTVKSYEAGLRADWLAGRLRTNLTVFYTDWANVPVSSYVATTFWDLDGNGFADVNGRIDANSDGVNDIFFFPNLFTVGVEEAVAQGVEFEATWYATDNLQFNANIGLLETEYKKLGQAALGVVPAVTTGSRFAGAPDMTASVSASYDYSMDGGASIVPRIDYTYTDDFTLQTGEILQRVQEAYGLLNARITYNSGSNWTASLSGTNLSDERYANSGFFTRSQQISFVTLGRPREWGLTFNFRFE